MFQASADVLQTDLESRIVDSNYRILQHKTFRNGYSLLSAKFRTEEDHHDEGQDYKGSFHFKLLQKFLQRDVLEIHRGAETALESWGRRDIHHTFIKLINICEHQQVPQRGIFPYGQKGLEMIDLS